jgi:hypothetical protein
MKSTELAYTEEGEEWTTIQGFTSGYWDNVLDRLRSTVPVGPELCGS